LKSKQLITIIKNVKMNKSNLVEAVVKVTGLTKVKATAVVNGILETMKAGLASGEKITLVGFGTFDTAVRKERKGRNPKTGEALIIPEKIAITFKAGTALKTLVNGGEATVKEDVKIVSDNIVVKDSISDEEIDDEVADEIADEEIDDEVADEIADEEFEA
jgi:DNA-binding protein HU-beta